MNGGAGQHDGNAGFVIATIGDNTIDRYIGDESARYAGGNAYNVAAQLAGRGRAVAYFGAVGADANSRTIARGLHRAGIEPVGLVTMAGPTAATTIRVDGGERVFEREEFGVTADYFPSDADLELLAKASWVHIGMLPRAGELRARLASLGRRAGAANRPVVSQDCAVASGFTELDVAFGSVGERGDARAWAISALGAGARSAVVTRGAAGAVATDGADWFEQRAVPVDVVDTTGAGDAFIAGFIAARLDGAEIPSALERGAHWAAAACSHRGGWPLARADTSRART
ncbi:PfkB family carbohydrate kinase [Agromyces ramosus]|uniref:Fructoselysine 6-kinase n=1 Tax=Agromyces ramosus TaxID=33879 RepID=A0ABU0R8L6_9MICO|nr:PfkB family carbohydrate kinase [Agromyces ramosus]MDQ0893561.1 fructoselysine 6-kinase [Agromyces ramosus]